MISGTCSAETLTSPLIDANLTGGCVTMQEYTTPISQLVRCSSCKKYKEASEFSKNRSRKNGLQNQCNMCHRKPNYFLIVFVDIFMKTWGSNYDILTYLENKIRQSKENLIEYFKIYRKVHRLEIYAQIKEWQQSNPSKVRAYGNIRRARKLEARIVDKFTDLEIFERDNWICSICHKKVNKRLKRPNLLSPSLDHVVPLAKGGDHSRQNVALAHLSCNVKKRHGTVVQQQRLF